MDIHINSSRFFQPTVLLLLAIFISLATSTHAQIGVFWPSFSSYETMSCSQLHSELAFMRRDLQSLQDPSQLGNPKWNEANNRFRIIIANYEERCATLSPQERAVPAPLAAPTLSEDELMASAKSAMKAGRFVDAQRILTDGAKAGYPSAQYDLGMLMIVTGDKGLGMYWLEQAANQGHAEAARVLQSLRGTP